MMMRQEVIKTKKAPVPTAPYSRTIKFHNLVFTAGAVGLAPKTGEIVEGGIKAQVKQTLHNL